MIASGGVSSIADVAALRSLVSDGVEGANIGKAVHRGFSLDGALDVVRA